MSAAEVWRDVPGFEGAYLVSNAGRVKSRARSVRSGRGGTRTIPERLLTPRVVKGYSHVTLQQDGRAEQRSIHRLVAEVFVPNPDRLPVVNHLDGEKANNRASNLEWTTHGGNLSHAFSAGLRSNQGEGSSRAKLTETDVRTIRTRLSAGETCAAIARDFPVSDRCISRIKRGKTWGHLQ
ncbi:MULTISPECIES: NUMOD4 domain-containing protein [Hyphobacterium]|uniref:NUMOD4 domain-containing protein n=1 Tax=Hyphobacterium vulgare TaxID=1736751 RepID=A0ABV6ZUA8_9PROT